MLILGRKLGESLILYTDDGLKITVVVTELYGGQVKLGIDAPPHVRIDRSEVYLRKQAEKNLA